MQKMWIYYGIALAATVLAGFLWVVVLDELRGSAPIVGAKVVSTSADPIPVVTPIVPADPVRATLYEDLQAGRALCDSDGYYARQTDKGTVRIVAGEGPVSCP